MQEMQETWVRSLGGEDLLEEGVATHSSILAWRIPWRGTWWATVHGAAKSQTQLKQLCTAQMIYKIKECTMKHWRKVFA